MDKKYTRCVAEFLGFSLAKIKDKTASEVQRLTQPQ